MNAHIEYALLDNHHVIKMSGEVRYGDVMSLQQYIELLAKNPKPYLIDLCDALLLDSTALGVLALMAKQSRDNKQQKPVLYAVKETVLEALDGVCFDMIFDIKREVWHQDNHQLETIEKSQLEFKELQDTVKSAHEALSEISDVNEEQFRDVNELLKKKH